MRTVFEFAKLACPKWANNERLLDVVIWQFTGFPHFWRIPRDGRTPVQCFWKQLRRAYRKYHGKEYRITGDQKDE